MKFWHLTTWQRWEPGQVYETLWEFNHYWQVQRKMPRIREAVEVLEILGVPEGIQRVLALQKRRAELLKEYVFEDIRRQYYEVLPSRFQAMFLVPLKVDLEAYRQRFGFGEAYRAVEVELVEIEKFHTTDPVWLDCNDLWVHEIEKRAHAYWQGLRRSAFVEVLFRGRFRILTPP